MVVDVASAHEEVRPRHAPDQPIRRRVSVTANQRKGYEMEELLDSRYVSINTTVNGVGVATVLNAHVKVNVKLV